MTHIDKIEADFDEKFRDDGTTSKVALKLHFKAFLRQALHSHGEQVREEGVNKMLADPRFYSDNRSYQMGRKEALKEAVEVVKSNSKGSFTDLAGHDCWYIDELVATLSALQTVKESGGSNK